jgi:hypothetical protein
MRAAGHPCRSPLARNTTQTGEAAGIESPGDITVAPIVTSGVRRAASSIRLIGRVRGPRHRAWFMSNHLARSQRHHRRHRHQNHIAESSKNRSLSTVEPNRLMARHACSPMESGRSNPKDRQREFMNPRRFWLVSAAALALCALVHFPRADATENVAAVLTYEAYLGGRD